MPQGFGIFCEMGLQKPNSATFHHQTGKRLEAASTSLPLLGQFFSFFL
jgi:hypothetical protein